MTADTLERIIADLQSDAEDYAGAMEHRSFADYLRETASRLAALRQQQGQEWRPIESAPKDGTRIITFAPRRTEFTRHIALNWFDKGAWQKCNSACQPTHWQPLPEPPEAPR